MKITPSDMGWKTKIKNMTNSGEKVNDLFPPGPITLNITARPGATIKEVVEQHPDWAELMRLIAPLEEQRIDLQEQISKFRKRLSQLRAAFKSAGIVKRAAIKSAIRWTDRAIKGHTKTLSKVLVKLQPLYKQKSEIMEQAKQAAAAVSVPVPVGDLVIGPNGELTTLEQADENDKKAKKKKRNEQIALVGSIVFAIIIVMVLVALWGKVKRKKS